MSLKANIRFDPRQFLRRAPLLLAALASLHVAATASEPVPIDSGSGAWYDSLEVTRPRYARVTAGEKLALAAFTALSIPVGLAVGGTAVMPPSLLMRHDGVGPVYGVALGSGVGFGGDTAASIHFPDLRLQVELGYYFERDPSFLVHASALMDQRLLPIDDEEFGWLAIAGGGGVASDFQDISPFAEAWVGLLNPMGIQFLPLYPMHHFGIRGRFGYDILAGRQWYEISLGATSTFQWKW